MIDILLRDILHAEGKEMRWKKNREERWRGREDGGTDARALGAPADREPRRKESSGSDVH